MYSSPFPTTASQTLIAIFMSVVITRPSLTKSRIRSFTIVALLASLVCGGRLACGGAGRRAVVGGLLRRIIGASHARLGDGAFSKNQGNRAVYGSFVSAVPLTPSFSRSTSSSDTSMESSPAQQSSMTCNEMTSVSCSENETSLPSKVAHPEDPSLWLYHVESTTSTMDEAKRIVENKFGKDAGSSRPTSFIISATSQSNGRGTTQRNWKSSQRGNALFTIGIQQSSWMNDLKAKNDGVMVPLTLLPLKVGSLVASHTERVLRECMSNSGGTTQQMMPRVTVKWPNDVLLYSYPDQSNDDHLSPTTAQGSYDKIAGILIESAQDWFLIGIGINVGYAPDIPKEGVDYGRKATCLSRFCEAVPSGDKIVSTGEDKAESEEEYWSQVSKKLATDIAYDLHSWFHPMSLSPFNNAHSGESILNNWKSYIDWDMELILRDTPKRERVKLKAILEDGRVVVQEVDTGLSRTLVSDYFL